MKKVIRCCKYFGVSSGMVVIVKLVLQRLNSIKLPCIKYPFMLRKNTSDARVFEQVFLNREYNNPLIIKELTSGGGGGKFVIDAGANIGLFAIWAKNLNPQAKIICIEPDPENFATLQKNTAPYTDIYCEQCGLWSSDARLNVYDKYNCGKWGMVVEEAANGSVSAICLDTLLKKYGVEQVDILKIDIETSEKQVFSANYEHWLPKCKMIVIEFHDRMAAGCAQTFFAAIQKTFPDYYFDISGENVIVVRN
jgi:FkbM family methyltransferase